MKSLHPKGMHTLCGIELIERVSYCGIQSLLVLYLAKAFALPQAQVYVIYGAFVGLTFIVSIGAGIVADRILGLPRAVTLGGISILLGNLLLALSSPHTVYLGLSL
ncbi:MAG: MFS transporter, partial [Gammaproteobacteria bacterium]|nr:MFS transporter [Gammaproteobacteria bacterium]